MNEQSKRAEARRRGAWIAARVASVGGIALAAAGIAMSAHAEPTDRAAAEARTRATHDDSAPLPLEALTIRSAKGCGCSPCWGPPAPPEPSSAEALA
ncbi:MAG: hypothetical protein KC657_31645 [Myxococcales bacterium]|nr:hypothetical protein [Myxococcales bacterium]